MVESRQGGIEGQRLSYGLPRALSWTFASQLKLDERKVILPQSFTNRFERRCLEALHELLFEACCRQAHP